MILTAVTTMLLLIVSMAPASWMRLSASFMLVSTSKLLLIDDEYGSKVETVMGYNGEGKPGE